jgi:hypothetical protein
MGLNDIRVGFDDGRRYLYRANQVIAFGEGALEFIVENFRGEEHGLDESARAVVARSGLPPISLLTDLSEDAPEVVRAARVRGHRVQPNHVFFAHGCCNCDPCCRGEHGEWPEDGLTGNPLRFNADGLLKANPLRFNPLRFNPLRFNLLVGDPLRFNSETMTTTAVPAAEPENLPAAADVDVRVWVLDTGLGTHAVAAGPVPIWEDGDVLGTGPGADVRTEWLGNRANVNGHETDHPDLFPGGVPPADGFIDPAAGHGSFIAGIIEQLQPGCELWVSRVMGENGDVSESDVFYEVTRLIGENPGGLNRTILNLSFGGELSGSCSALEEAVKMALQRDIVVVASAGNEASCEPSYPAAFDGVISVGALDDGAPAEFTNYGSWVTACAEGVDLVSTFLKADGDFPLTFVWPPGVAFDPDNFEASGGWARWSGTSFAAPVVAATIAQELAKDPQLTGRDAAMEVLARNAEVPCLGVPVIPDEPNDAVS